MQPFLLTDYILGNTFSEKYANTFIGEVSFYIYSLPDVEFIKDVAGNYLFKEKNEYTDPFIKASYFNPSLGNFFIIFQKYMKSPLNLIQSKKYSYSNQFSYKSITCYIKLNQIQDNDGEFIKDAFVMIDTQTLEVVLVYFYGDSNKVGHFRTNIPGLILGKEINEHDKQVLSIIQEYQKNPLKYKETRDILKKKYKGRFTEQPYVQI